MRRLGALQSITNLAELTFERTFHKRKFYDMAINWGSSQKKRL